MNETKGNLGEAWEAFSEPALFTDVHLCINDKGC